MTHKSRLSDLLAPYDALICDVWGVLHNGVAAYPEAPEALRKARKAGKIVVLLTNAPRPSGPIRAQLAQLGIDESAYDAILSSGGVMRDLIAQEGDKPFYFLGPQRDQTLFAGLAARPVPFEAAAYILCTGLFDDTLENAQTYRPMLAQALARTLPLFCANPDLVVERGGHLIPCAGAIADLYEKMGGVVHWVGKPHPLVYAHAQAEIEHIAGCKVPKARVLAIGDAFRTDILGGMQAGYDVLATLGGIHAEALYPDGKTLDEPAFLALCAHYGVTPRWRMQALVW